MRGVGLLLVLLIALILRLSLVLALVFLTLLFLVRGLVLVCSINYILNLIEVLELELSGSFVRQRLVTLWRRLKFRLTGEAIILLLLYLAAY